MATINLVGNGLSGATGTGTFVGSTSPTLVTPVLGVAAATSVNFGQDPLNYYDEGTFTPTFTFATPGNLSVSYATQTGYYTRIGNVVTFYYVLVFTPTFTTASGIARFSSLPFAVNSDTTTSVVVGNKSANITFNTGDTYIVGVAVAGTSYIQIRTYTSATGNNDLTIARFTSGASHTIALAGQYFI